VLKAHRLCISLNSRLQGNKEEEEVQLPTTPEISLNWSHSVTFAVKMVLIFTGLVLLLRL